MDYNTPDHYSYKFKFDINNLPAQQKDKLPNKLSICGIIFGSMFALLGGYELIAYLFNFSDESYNFSSPTRLSANEIFIQRYTFDTFILFFGIIIVSISIMALLRYKKIYFDGTNVEIEHKPLFGEVQKESEKLKNYIGVLLKVEYYQLGLINRNRYIIELYHKEKSKRIPLYISTKSDKVRATWEYYAEKLKMPALFMTDHGLVSRNHGELTKTLKDMAKRWHLNALYNDEEHAPASIKYSAKGDKIILKERRWFFDVYTVLACAGMFIMGLLFLYATANSMIILPYTGAVWYTIFMCVIGLILLFSIIIVFSKDVLIITSKSVILGHNLSFLRIDAESMDKDKIEAVDIGHNPTTDRYYLSVISHDKSIIFGKNMPIADLRWIRGCVIRKIVK